MGNGRHCSSFKAPIEATANKILTNKEKYEAVGAMTNVPWVRCRPIHQMESGCRFTCHLHNGDPLSAKTVNVPERPAAQGNSRIPLGGFPPATRF